MTHREYMQRAIELALKGVGHTNPNPLVGAVIVRDGEIIAEGYHAVCGSLHAERNALKNLVERQKPEAISPGMTDAEIVAQSAGLADGAVMYVTLEPCCHYGKQPPCTEAVIASGIKKVFIGSSDPNPKVAGKGVKLLKDAGIETVEDFMRAECDRINPVFFHFISTGEPYIAVKYAMTADGKTATGTGKSQWITGEEARKHVHELRNYYKGILVGIGTVLADDPMLTCRIDGGRNPVRIVLDTKLRIPEDSRLVKSVSEAPLMIVCSYSADPDKKARLREAGAEIIETEQSPDGGISICDAVRELGQRGIDGVLVEGGGTVNASFIKAGKVNRVYTYIGAKIFGGMGKHTPVGGEGIDEVAEALALADPAIRVFGDDVLIRYDVKKIIKMQSRK